MGILLGDEEIRFIIAKAGIQSNQHGQSKAFQLDDKCHPVI